MGITQLWVGKSQTHKRNFS